MKTKPVRCVRFPRAALFAASASLLLSSASTPAAPAAQAAEPAAPAVPGAPPQDQGLPYTRSARAKALAAIRDYVALFPGSRYAYVHGYKARLEEDTPEHLLHTEAVEHDGRLFVPESFVGVLSLKDVKPEPAPQGLAGRWVYSVPRPAAPVPKSVTTLPVKGESFVDVAAAAKALGLTAVQYPRGLVLVGTGPIKFDCSDPALTDDVVTLFDTPDKFADPDVATRSVPRLKEQGPWTDHVKTTPQQLKLLEGPETEWPTAPRGEYDLSGFNASLLGSKVPPPGAYPRLLFSAEDLPMLLNRMKQNKLGQKALIEWEVLFHKSWWDPKTDDGRIFQKLAAGDTADLQWADGPPGALPFQVSHGTFRGQKPGIYTSHVNYVSNCLVTMSLYCLLTGDDAHGKQAAAALANYYRLVEPAVDSLNAMSDSELGSNPDLAGYGETSWRGMHGVVGHMDLPFALDFAGKWMSDADKDSMRRIIAKATYGRRDNMQAAPDRVKDINHMSWHLTNFLAASAIEGQEGCDPEVTEAGRESCEAFLDWGIDKYGQMFESNGKSGGGMQFELLSMIVLARRGDNLFGHPHFRKLLDAQVQTTSPNGQATVSSGTWGGSPFAFQATDEIKAFYPGNLAADWLLTQQFPQDKWADFDPAAYREKLEKNPKETARMRLPGPTYPNLAYTGIYDADWKPVPRADLKLPDTWNDDVHGILSAYSDDTPQAAWLCLHVRANQYIASGHHHGDVGMFYFSGAGENWVTESPFQKTYDGKYHNEVLIDGVAEPDGYPGVGKYLGASVSPLAAFGSVDQTHSYSYRVTNQVQLWKPIGHDLWDKGMSTDQWELETDPLPLSVYRGTQRYKSRPWWPTYNFSNWMPVVRAPFNPVQYAFRTAGLVRGPHPYGVVVDDVKKDDREHLYQWTAMLGEGVWQAEVPNLPPGQVVLGYAAPSAKTPAARGHAGPLQPHAGDPLLLVCAFDARAGTGGTAAPVKVETAHDGPDEGKGAQSYDRMAVDLRGDESHYKVLLVPYHNGEPLPKVTCDPAAGAATVTWDNQKDTLHFTAGADHRTHVDVSRGTESAASVR